jgi:hypothetical protein
MGHTISVGDTVAFLDAEGKAVVKAVLNTSQLLIETEDGFEETVAINAVIKLGSGAFGKADVGYVPQKQEPRKQHAVQKKKSTVDGLLWEIDLHIEVLLDYHRNMSNYEIIQYQLRYCEFTLLKAQKNKVQKLVVIHGKGEGVLKEEVYVLARQHDLHIREADFRRYGGGASEIVFY